jgi:hypothetical protein
MPSSSFYLTLSNLVVLNLSGYPFLKIPQIRRIGKRTISNRRIKRNIGQVEGLDDTALRL